MRVLDSARFRELYLSRGKDVQGIASSNEEAAQGTATLARVWAMAGGGSSVPVSIGKVGEQLVTTIEAIGATTMGATLQKAWLDLEVLQCGLPVRSNHVGHGSTNRYLQES